MSQHESRSKLGFLRKNSTTLISLAVLIASIVLVRWVVIKFRPPGAMTVVEAQAMDMTAMKAPPGVKPVAVEPVALRQIAPTETFPATINAYSDEDVVARIPGRVSATMVYPGDTVSPGQLLATLEADEYAFQQAEALNKAGAYSWMVTAAEREVETLRTGKRRAESDAAAMSAAVARAVAEYEGAVVHLEHMKEVVEQRQAAVAEMRAELDYAEKNLEREQQLYAAGATSLDELQIAQKARDTAAAKVAAAVAELNAEHHNVNGAARELDAAREAVTEAKARHKAAMDAVSESDRMIAKAQSELQAQRAEAKAMRSGASAASVVAAYRQLRALGSGVVSERLVSPGTLVMPGQTVFKIKVVNRMRIQAQLPERLASKVSVGMPLRVITDGAAVDARVTSVFSAVNADTRTFTVEALLDNKSRTFLAGQFAQVGVATGPKEEALAVRASAIKTDASGNKYVWLMKEKEGSGEPTDYTCTMHPEVSQPRPGICPICKMDLVPRTKTGKFYASRRNVSVGPSDGVYTAVRSGLTEGENVIWAGTEDLYEDAPVEAVEWSPEGPKQLPGGTGTTTHEHGAMPSEPAQKPQPKQKDETPPMREHLHDNKVNKQTPKASSEEEGVDKSAQKSKDLYTCPMHPDVIQEGPGTCPKCKMDLVPKKAGQ